MKIKILKSMTIMALAFNSVYAINLEVNYELKDQNIAWKENYDGEILKLIQNRNKNIIAVEKKVVIPNPETASKASRILYLRTIDNKSYVVKEITSSEEIIPQEINREKKLIETNLVNDWNDFIKFYEVENNIKLPKLVKYLDSFSMSLNSNFQYFTLMTQAEGMSLKDIRLSFWNPDLEITEQEAASIGNNIGIQMGNLAKAFYEKKGSYLKHADPGGQNFFYDKKSQQFYWIDLGGSEETSYLHPNEFESYRDSESYVIKAIWWSLFPYQKSSELIEINKKLSKNLSNINLLKSQRLAIIAGNSFFDSYKKIITNLKPEQDRLKNINTKKYEDNIFDLIDNMNFNYLNKIDEIFGNKASEVKNYLFNPVLDASTPMQGSNLDAEISNFITSLSADLELNIVENSRYRDIYPIGDELRILGYYDYPLTHSYCNENRKKIISSEVAKKKIYSTIEVIVNTKQNIIKDKLMDFLKVNNYTNSKFEFVKSEIIKHIYKETLDKLIIESSLQAYRN